MNQVSPLDQHRDEVLELVRSNTPTSAILARLAGKGVHTSDRSISRALKRWNEVSGGTKPEREYLRIENDKAEFVTSPEETVGTPEELMAQVGLDPEFWEVGPIIVNKYRAMTGKTRGNELVWMYQLKITCTRKKPYDFLLPAVESTYVAPRTPVYKWDNARLVMVAGDQQCPYVDERLHEKACQWIERNKPDQMTLTGDGIDLPTISRHPDNPEWHLPVQDCLNSCYSIYRDYRRANEQMEMVKLLGNHDERIRTRLLAYLTGLYDLRPAWVSDEESEPRRVWDIHNILRLDDLNIRVIDPNGGYAHAQHQISPHVAVRHGWLAKKGAGASALATLEALGYSIFVGHTHRQAVVHKTTHDINGSTTTLVAVETGCMCRIEQGLGYAVAPDWQQGFATAVVHADGVFKPELATYVNNTLIWRDQRF